MKSSKVEHFPKAGSDEEAERNRITDVVVETGKWLQHVQSSLMTEVKSSCSGPTTEQCPR